MDASSFSTNNTYDNKPEQKKVTVKDITPENRFIITHIHLKIVLTQNAKLSPAIYSIFTIFSVVSNGKISISVYIL